MAIFFVQPCSNCSRNRQVPIKELGHVVRCPHCGQMDKAEDPHADSLAMNDCMKLVARLADISPPDDAQSDVAPDVRRPR